MELEASCEQYRRALETNTINQDQVSKMSAKFTELNVKARFCAGLVTWKFRNTSISPCVMHGRSKLHILNVNPSGSLAQTNDIVFVCRWRRWPTWRLRWIATGCRKRSGRPSSISLMARLVSFSSCLSRSRPACGRLTPLAIPSCSSLSQFLTCNTATSGKGARRQRRANNLSLRLQ